jgi:uncharacterized protein DUF4168
MLPRCKSRCLIFAFAIYGLITCLGAVSFAQQTPGTQDALPAKVNDNELRSFVRAYVENQRIRQRYEPELEKTSDPNRNRQIQDQANEELKKSLARHNLTVDEYNRIYNQVNSDEQLRKKTLKLVQEERSKASAPSGQSAATP